MSDTNDDDFVWVQDHQWIVPSKYQRCRHRGCQNSPVADLARGTTAQRWAYCADHLYGRRFVNGRIMVRVRKDGPLAGGQS